jgi:flagellar biosynthetic protein FlhB
MSSERTEQATPRRLEKARSEGQISKSQDLNSALVLSANMAILFMMAPAITQELTSILKYTLSNLNPDKIDSSIINILVPYFKSACVCLLPILLASLFSSIIIIRLLVGSLFSLGALAPKWDKFMPSAMLKALKNKFNPVEPKQIVELVKSFLKLSIVGSVGYSTVMDRLTDLLGLLGVPIQTAFATIVSIMLHMVINMCVAMIIIGIFDKKYQDYEYNKSLKMSKQEVKDEAKNADGDPKIKQKIKSAQMQMSRQKMMNDVKTADVVVTNPTHYAVAIRYDTSKAPAPQVVAKGVDFMAFKIREIAEANNIPIQENKPLARTLYKVVPLDGIVPPELYVAVAELLAFVYNRNRGD